MLVEVNKVCRTILCLPLSPSPKAIRTSSVIRSVTPLSIVSCSKTLGSGSLLNVLPRRCFKSVDLLLYLLGEDIPHMEGHDDHPGVALPLLPRDRHRPAWYVV